MFNREAGGSIGVVEVFPNGSFSIRRLRISWCHD